MADDSALDATPRVVWLFGHPVGHSLSPLMQNAAFHYAGVALKYVARDVEPDELPAAVNELRGAHARGANLTIPHKETVLHLLDEVDTQAARIGAVNTIVNDVGKIKGYNTDIGGFSRALRSCLPEGAKGRQCLVLGAGGAARAVVAALQRDEAGRIWVANRTPGRAAALCEAAAHWGTTKCAPLGLDEAGSVVAGCQIVVNATSLGLPGSVKDLPIDVDKLHDSQVLVDLAYGTSPTPLVRAAESRGLVAVDGKEMLLQQAALSFELWTGRGAPIDLMRGSIGGS